MQNKSRVSFLLFSELVTETGFIPDLLQFEFRPDFVLDDEIRTLEHTCCVIHIYYLLLHINIHIMFYAFYMNITYIYE